MSARRGSRASQGDRSSEDSTIITSSVWSILLLHASGRSGRPSSIARPCLGIQSFSTEVSTSRVSHTRLSMAGLFHEGRRARGEGFVTPFIWLGHPKEVWRKKKKFEGRTNRLKREKEVWRKKKSFEEVRKKKESEHLLIVSGSFERMSPLSTK